MIINNSISILIVMMGSFIIWIYAYFKHETSYIRLHILRFIHIFVVFLIITYYILFDSKYDKLFILVFILMVTHWYLIKNECFLTYLEKKLENEHYQLGDFSAHPAMNSFTSLIVMSLQFISFTLVFYRFTQQCTKELKIKNQVIWSIVFILFILSNCCKTYNKEC
jgi:hypothetical protein